MRFPASIAEGDENETKAELALNDPVEVVASSHAGEAMSNNSAVGAES